MEDSGRVSLVPLAREIDATDLVPDVALAEPPLAFEPPRVADRLADAVANLARPRINDERAPAAEIEVGLGRRVGLRLPLRVGDLVQLALPVLFQERLAPLDNFDDDVRPLLAIRAHATAGPEGVDLEDGVAVRSAADAARRAVRLQSKAKVS